MSGCPNVTVMATSELAAIAGLAAPISLFLPQNSQSRQPTASTSVEPQVTESCRAVVEWRE